VVKNSSRVLISDTLSHRFNVVDFSGQLLASSAEQPEPEFCFSNQFIVVDELLFLADTNYHRIAEIPIVNAVPSFERIVSHEMVDHDDKRRTKRCGKNPAYHDGVNALKQLPKDHIWPVSIARDEKNGWWVILKDVDLKLGSVAHFSSDWALTHVLNLPTDLYVDELLSLGTEIVISDGHRGALHSVKHGELSAKPWGDARFQQTMKDRFNHYKNERIAFLNLMPSMMVGLVLFMAPIIFLSRRQVAAIRNVPLQHQK
jgi:hypothetical protein